MDLREVKSRRMVFAAALRYAALGLLGAAGGSALAKRRRLLREGRCMSDGVCRGCVVFERCGLPQALSAKEVLARQNDGREQ